MKEELVLHKNRSNCFKSSIGDGFGNTIQMEGEFLSRTNGQ
ncbi:hypothetical protein ACQKMZ_06270 [Bacillus paramycoides]